MASSVAKAAISEHFALLFASAISAGLATLTALRNLENPEPPHSEAALGQTHCYLYFSGHAETAVCFGGETTPWRERGVFLFHVVGASGRGEAAIDAMFKTGVNSLRNQTIGGRVDILKMFGADSGARFGGNWWGQSIAVEYQVEDVGN